MVERLACIGLDPSYVATLKKAYETFGHVVIPYDVPPRMYSHLGKLYAESQQVAGRFLGIDQVVWYSYFPGNALAPDVRKAIALSDVRSFPDVRTTILHDDRALSLVLATQADPGPRLSRGYVAPGARCLFESLSVLKVGNDHCGDGKLLVEGVVPDSNVAGIVEPFIRDAESIRILIANDTAWSLKYESSDWRKNVKAKVTEVPLAERPTLVPRARILADHLKLSIVGIDFIGSNDAGWNLLEVNAYPSLDDVVEAQDTFKRMLCDFVW
jgi:hypothetical protein